MLLKAHCICITMSKYKRLLEIFVLIHIFSSCCAEMQVIAWDREAESEEMQTEKKEEILKVEINI